VTMASTSSSAVINSLAGIAQMLKQIAGHGAATP